MICIETAKSYCNEDISLIENYEKAINSDIKWECHHRKEIELDVGVKELIEMNLYYNRPASELIFLTAGDHRRLHMQHYIATGKTKEMFSRPGELNPSWGVPKRPESIEKMRQAKLGKSSWNKGLKGYHKTYKWYNNGEICIRAEECPEGFVPGRGSLSSKGKPNNHHWYTNGKVNVQAKECPEGFWPGRDDSLYKQKGVKKDD